MYLLLPYSLGYSEVVNKRITKLFKWIGSHEQLVRESNSSDEHSQCCAAGVSNGGWSAKRPTLHINDFYWNKHSTKINEYVKYIWIIHFPHFRPRLTID